MEAAKLPRTSSGMRAATRDRAGERATIEPGDAMWLALVPAALVTVALAYLFGEPLGALLYPAHNPYTYWDETAGKIRPEHGEQARFLLLLAGPILLSAAGALLCRRGARGSARAVRFGVLLSQGLLIAFVAFCVVSQWSLTYGDMYDFGQGEPFRREYFTPRTLAVAALLTAAVVLIASKEDLRARFRSAVADSRAWRIGGFAAAAIVTVAWLLPAVNSDRSIADANDAISYHIEFTMDETFAVLNGLSPLVDFTAQYGSLWPYAVAPVLSLFGENLLVFTIAMCAITGLAALALYDALRRIAGSAAIALLLFVPVIATGFFLIRGDDISRYSMSGYFGAFPLRYAGPLLLAWLTTIRLQRGSGRWDWALFAFAGLVVVNNTDFGVPALGASIAAILWTGGRPSPRTLGGLLLRLVAGIAIAVALVSLLTLVRAGTLPQFGRLLEYARMYTLGGFAMLPMPGLFGLHTVIYATYAAAIVTATARALRRAENVALTGMLAWSGIFGLGSGAYYVGRSHPETLTATFMGWALALALLALVAVPAIASRRRRPALAAVLAVFGFAVCACSLAQFPPPWLQLERLGGQHASSIRWVGAQVPEPFVPDESWRWFYSSTAYDGKLYIKEGAPVLNLTTSGHRLSAAFGVRNVSRYTGASIAGPKILRRVLDDLRRAGGNTLFIELPSPDRTHVLVSNGFLPVTPDGIATRRDGIERVAVVSLPYTYTRVTKWVDSDNPRPAYLAHDRGEPYPFTP